MAIPTKNLVGTLNESIIMIRVKLQQSNLKKSGYNKFSGFYYFELADFLPRLNELMLEEGINDIFCIEDGVASLELIKGEERQKYTIPFVQFPTPLTYKKDKRGDYLRDENGALIQVPSMQDIQYLGALNTYCKRYLYLNAFGITDGEVIDSMDNTESAPRTEKSSEKKPERKASKKQLDLLGKWYTGKGLEKLLKENGLSKLEDITLNKASELISAHIENERELAKAEAENFAATMENDDWDFVRRDI